MNRAITIATILFLCPAAAAAQDFVSECTLDTTDQLCQTNGVWGSCYEAGPNSCQGENPDAPGECRGFPDCGIAFCAAGAVRGDSCVVADESGGCIPLCEVDFDVDCATGGADLVCEIGSMGTFDEGDDVNCSTTPASPGPGWIVALLAGLLFWRRR